ncbi:MAG: hypothetical protein J7M19_10155 [Planctomycetes bacterium]|nr:hypothetical protein [Planctomycetota bacterium]
MNQIPRKNRRSQNRKWFVPVLTVGAIVVSVGFCIGIAYLFFGLMKSSNAYKGAVARASESSAVTAMLGSPVKAGFFLSGNISLSGSSGQADLAIPISGPKGKGVIYVEATKSAGKWTFTKLAVRIKDSRQHIDLLAEEEPLPARAGP